MASVPSVIQQLLAASPALEESLHRDLLNISAYAREIQPVVEKKTRKSVTIAAISMAMRRLQTQQKKVKKVRTPEVPGMHFHVESVQSEAGLVLLSYPNQARELQAIEKLLPTLGSGTNVVRGIWSIDMIVSETQAESILHYRALRQPQICKNDLAALSLRIKHPSSDPHLTVTVLRELAQQNIAARYINQSHGEMTVLVDNHDLVLAVATLQKHLELHR
jgi:hypothetical protein